MSGCEEISQHRGLFSQWQNPRCGFEAARSPRGPGPRRAPPRGEPAAPPACAAAGTWQPQGHLLSLEVLFSICFFRTVVTQKARTLWEEGLHPQAAPQGGPVPGCGLVAHGLQSCDPPREQSTRWSNKRQRCVLLAPLTFGQRCPQSLTIGMGGGGAWRAPLLSCPAEPIWGLRPTKDQPPFLEKPAHPPAQQGYGTGWDWDSSVPFPGLTPRGCPGGGCWARLPVRAQQ